jgi:DNA polymerase III epsilon subunit-like protein
MKITRHNLDEQLPAIAAALRKAAFVAFDLEFTGLAQPTAVKQTFLDTVDQRFAAAYESTGGFFPLQLGLAVFEAAPEQHVWNVTPLSIYCMPAEDDRTYMIQPQSIAYLASNSYDFQSSFAHGVGWLTVEQQARRELQLAERHNAKRGEEIVVSSDRDKEFVKAVTAMLLQPASGSPLLEQPGVAVPERFRSFFVMRPLGNRFLRRLVHETIARVAPNTVVVALPDERMAFKALGSPQEVEQFQRQMQEEKREEIRRSAGVRRVLDLIAELRVPVVGHNSLLDMLHVLRICSSNVNDNLTEFKKLAVGRFPGGVIDTKFIARNVFPKDRFGGTGLEDLVRELPAEGGAELRLPSGGAQQYHDACFDAVQTGRVFVGLAGLAKIGWKELRDRSVWHLPLNSSDTVMRLDAHDPSPDFGNVLLAINFPAEWRQADLAKAVQERATRFVWLNDVACAMVFRDKTEAEEILRQHAGPFGLKKWEDRSEDDVRPGKKRQRHEQEEDANKEPAKRSGIFGWVTSLFK